MNTDNSTRFPVRIRKKIDNRPTLEMPKVELEAILTVDAAVGLRENVYQRPTIEMQAVKSST
jgi:hypothetical protein